MRRSATVIVVAGLAALALAAGIDALRGGRGEPAPPATVAETEPAVASVLDKEGVRGVITYSDEACRLHAVALPALRPARAPAIEMCRPLIGTGGIRAWRGEVVWSGLGYGTVQTVLSRDELGSAIARHPRAELLAWQGRGGYDAWQAVPLGGERYAVIVQGRRADWERMIAVFERGRLDALSASGWVGEGDVLRPSPRGRYFAVLHPGEPGIRLFTRDGEPLSLPDVTNPHAIAWSPDERWTALATRWSIYVFPSDQRGATMRLPVSGVDDLAWSFRD